MKQKISNKSISQAGFTVVELLAVMAIMTLLLGALVLDFAGQRGKRNIVLAKNETATNLRKVQSYMLSSKNHSTGVAVKYYVATFSSDADKNLTYTVDAVDNNYNFLPVETVKLPTYTKISAIRAVTSPGVEQSFNCVQVIFSAPFGKVYTNGAATCSSGIKDVLKDPVQRSQLSEKTTRVYFAESTETTGTSYLEIVPVTGQMATY